MNAVVKPSHVPAVRTDTSSNMLSIIAQAAADPRVDVIKMTALLDLQEKLLLREAQSEFNKALSRLNIDDLRVAKNGSVTLGTGRTSYKFAKWEDMDRVIRPLMQREGFTLSFDTAIGPTGGMIVIGELLHEGGHSRTARIPLALDTGPGRNALQAMGSTVSYGKRYVTEMLLNIVREDEDDDGQGGAPPQAQHKVEQRSYTPRQSTPSAVHSHRDSAINDEIPDRVMNSPSSKPKRTVGGFLADIATQLSACTIIDEVTSIASSDPVQSALAALKNGALQELNAMLAEAVHRTEGTAMKQAEGQQIEEMPPAAEQHDTVSAQVLPTDQTEEIIPQDTQPVINPQEASAQKALDGILRELAEAVALSERQKSPGPIIDMLTNPLKQNRIGRFKQAYKSKYREVLLACAKSPILDVMREIQAAYPEFCDDVIDVTQVA